MATKVWKGFVTFGALSIPVYLNTAAREKKIELHGYHVTCNSAIKMPKVCPTCDETLEGGAIYKGYEVSSGEIVPLTAEELEAITPETERVMEIAEIVKTQEVDPIYLAESFYLLPDDAGKKAYSLLVKMLTDSGRVAIARLTKSQREHVVLIRPKGNGLMVHYLWYESEINQVPEFENLQLSNLSAAEIKLAGQLADSLTGDFDASQYEDGYAQRLNTLIASKLDKRIAAPVPVKSVTAASKEQDITSLLTASLATAKPHRKIKLENEPAKKSAPKKAAKKVA